MLTTNKYKKLMFSEKYIKFPLDLSSYSISPRLL